MRWWCAATARSVRCDPLISLSSRLHLSCISPASQVHPIPQLPCNLPRSQAVCDAITIGNKEQKFAVFDLNPVRVAAGLQSGAPIVYGDGSSAELLRAAGKVHAEKGALR